MQLNVLSFQSIFTNANGNTSDLTKNVDFIYDKSECTFNTTTNTFDKWNTASGVKIGFNVSSAIATGNATYYFYREKGSSGANSLVHAAYTNSTYPATNDTKYAAGSLDQV